MTDNEPIITAQRLCSDNQYADARIILYDLIADDPTDWRAHLQLAVACCGLKRPDLASRHIDIGEILAETSGEETKDQFAAMRHTAEAERIRSEAERIRSEAERIRSEAERIKEVTDFDPIRNEMKSGRYHQFHENTQGIVRGSFAHFLAQNSLDIDLNETQKMRLTAALDSSLEDQAKLVREVESFSSWPSHMSHTLRAVSVDGAYFEFGVLGGGSANFIASKIPGKILHGFDAFQGTPEGHEDEPNSWADPWPDRKGELPELDDNVELHVGWFKESLPTFKNANDQAVAFAHIDCDLYSSTITIFEELGDRIRPGTVLVFDEYPIEEYQAFKIFTATNGLDFEYLSCDLNGISVSLIIR